MAKQKTYKRRLTKLKKRQKTRKVNHKGGNQQLTNGDVIGQIITLVNGTPDLITEINNALQNYNLQKSSTNDKVKALQQKYSTGLSSYQLYDLIYADQSLEVYNSQKRPSLIWNHGINNPKSITAGKLGTHIYIYKDSKSGLYKLLGVIIRKDKMSMFDTISEGLTFMGL
jgi:hypothetical protein